MEDFKSILFPVDFSTRCENTVPYVKEFARQHSARVSLVHVVEIPIYWYGTGETCVAWDSFEELARVSQQSLANFACDHFSDLTEPCSVEIFCDRGDPGYAILARAEQLKADLIMMPTHGQGPFRSFVMGSATTRVLHNAKCAVWTGAHLESDPLASHAQIKTILCALDLEKESCQVIQSAMVLGETFSARVRLVHCIAVPKAGQGEDFRSEFDRFLADSARKRLAEIQRCAGTNLEVCLEGGSVSRVVRDAASHFAADLVVIGRGRAGAAQPATHERIRHCQGIA